MSKSESIATKTDELMKETRKINEKLENTEYQSKEYKKLKKQQDQLKIAEQYLENMIMIKVNEIVHESRQDRLAKVFLWNNSIELSYLLNITDEELKKIRMFLGYNHYYIQVHPTGLFIHFCDDLKPFDEPWDDIEEIRGG